MKLDKNGYQSEKRDSFATAVKVLTFIFGLVVVVAAVCVYAMFSGCGSGGSDSSTPVYDDTGVCVNCGNGDASVTSQDSDENGDTPPTYADGKPIPQPDTVPYVCPVSEPPEMCVPKEAEEARCIFYDYKTDSNPDCDLSQTDHCWCSGGFYDQVDCSSQSSCQKVPPDAWPPCVCWEFCEYAGEFVCFGYNYTFFKVILLDVGSTCNFLVQNESAETEDTSDIPPSFSDCEAISGHECHQGFNGNLKCTYW